MVLGYLGEAMNTVRMRITNLLALMATPSTRALVQKGAWAFADQVQISLTNFLTTVLLARALLPDDFGLYALMYMALLFLNMVQSALINQPLIALGAPRTGRSAVSYITATMWTQMALAFVSAVIMATFALVSLWRWPHATTAILICALGTIAWQMQEYIRRVLYIRSRPSAAFANDIVSYSGQFLLLVLLWQVNHLTISTALWAFTATSFMGVTFGLWQARNDLSGRTSLGEFHATVVENWIFGRWLLGSNVATWTSGRFYPILAAGFVSVAATGAMRVIQNTLGPMNVLVFSLDSLLGPKAARTNAQGGLPALRVFVKRMQIIMLLTVGTYCLVVSIFASPILKVVYGDRYAGYGWLLSILAANYALYAFRSPMILALTVLHRTRSVFLIWIKASIVTLSTGVVAAYAFGLPGIGFVIIESAVILQRLTWLSFRNVTQLSLSSSDTCHSLRASTEQIPRST